MELLRMGLGRSTRRLCAVSGLAVLAACVTVALTARAAEGNKDHGKTVYMANCAMCHGKNGEGTKTGPELFYGPDLSETIKTVTEGKDSGKPNKMPAFSGALSEQDIADVAAYVTGEIEGGG